MSARLAERAQILLDQVEDVIIATLESIPGRDTHSDVRQSGSSPVILGSTYGAAHAVLTSALSENLAPAQAGRAATHKTTRPFHEPEGDSGGSEAGRHPRPPPRFCRAGREPVQQHPSTLPTAGHPSGPLVHVLPQTPRAHVDPVLLDVFQARLPALGTVDDPPSFGHIDEGRPQ